MATIKNKIYNNIIESFEKNLDHLIEEKEKFLMASKKIADSFESGGRIILISAGILPDIATIVFDELTFLFGIERGRFISITAGKEYRDILETWREMGDEPAAGVLELENLNLTEEDFVMFFSQSGKTEFVTSGFNYALQKTKNVLLITNSEKDEYESEKIINTNFEKNMIIGFNIGNVLTMQKMILDLITYDAMELLGRIWNGFLVYHRPFTQKMKDECLKILEEALHLNRDEVEELFKRCEDRTEIALIVSLLNVSVDEAKEKLEESKGNFNKIF